jgi:twitching motility two-component system response regulator PilH
MSKIFVIDDDLKALLLIETMLKPSGHDLVLQNHSRLAIQSARKEKPDIILLDVMMPFVDGYTLLNQLQNEEELRNIPIVMVSAVEYEDNKELARLCGASAYVTKPVDRKVLLDTISRFLPDSAPST